MANENETAFTAYFYYSFLFFNLISLLKIRKRNCDRNLRQNPMQNPMQNLIRVEPARLHSIRNAAEDRSGSAPKSHAILSSLPLFHHSVKIPIPPERLARALRIS